MQRLLGLCGLVLGAVAHHSVPLGQVEVECDQGAVLHAQGPQSGTINLEHTHTHTENGEKFRCSYYLSISIYVFLSTYKIYAILLFQLLFASLSQF